MERFYKMIIDFLKTKRDKNELTTALEVLREFKSCESTDEYILVPLLAWTKLEQLEEFLNHLVVGSPLKNDTLRELERLKSASS